MSVRVARLVQFGGIALVTLGAAKLHAERLAAERYPAAGTSRFWWALALVLVLTVTAYGLGLPEVTRNRRDAISASISTVVVSQLAISVAMLVLGQALLPRFVLAASSVLVVPWLFVCAGLVRDGIDRAAARDRVAIVADWADAASLAAELETASERPAQVVAMMPTSEAAADAQSPYPLVNAVIEHGATVVVLDRIAQLHPSIVEQAAVLHERGIRIRTLSIFYEQWLGKLPLAELERVSLMFDIGELHRIRYGRFKRFADLALAAIGCLALVPLTLMVLAGNAVANRGPLFFRQERVGKGGQIFVMVKFRTMRIATSVPPDECMDRWTSKGDDRVTSFGGFLRRTHLDELPQVLNVLRGDLSIVGPRPEQPRYVAELSQKLPFYNLRHLVQPGLTGWAQVKFPYGSSEEDASEKLQYEFWYLRHQCLSLDLRIVFRTLRSVLGREGR